MKIFEFDKDDNMNWDNIKTISEFDGDDGPIFPAHTQGGSGDATPSSSPRYTDQKSINELTAGRPTTSTSLLIESLVQLLCICLENDPQVSDQSYRAICEQLAKINLIDDSYAMSEFEEMRSQYQMQIYKIIRAVGGHEIPKTLPTVIAGNSHPIETCWSRYRREFNEVEFIAGGGFGKVFKARHKLDCIEYAIKQIKIHSTTIKLCHLAEVKTIASLNHPNVVQYKAAWLEPYVANENPTHMINSESHNPSELDTNNSVVSSSRNSSISSRNEDSDDSDSSALPPRRSMVIEDSSSFICFEHSHEQSEKTTDSRATTSSCHQQICKYESYSVEEKTTKKKQKLAILYIQMSLCQLTLRKWLDDRNASTSMEEYYIRFFKNRNEISHLDIVHDLFYQILSGLNYIHSRNIIHHDIKPSNIFLEIDDDGRLTAQLGDFGLACPLQNGHEGVVLGTPLYAAPEQLEGECNFKSDIYSLGIVLIELLLKFGTDMERVRTIENARKGILPPTLNKRSTKLLQNLLSDEPTRPATKDLMEVFRKINLEQHVRAFRTSENNSTRHDKKITELYNQINTMRENTETINNQMHDMETTIRKQSMEIVELKDSLAEKDNEIALLRMQLLEYQMKTQ